MKPRSVSQLPLTDRDAIPFKQLPKETQEWIIAWNKTLERLGLTAKEFFALHKLTMKIRWGFTAADLELIPPKERDAWPDFVTSGSRKQIAAWEVDQSQIPWQQVISAASGLRYRWENTRQFGSK